MIPPGFNAHARSSCQALIESAGCHKLQFLQLVRLTLPISPLAPDHNNYVGCEFNTCCGSVIHCLHMAT